MYMEETQLRSTSHQGKGKKAVLANDFLKLNLLKIPHNAIILVTSVT